MSPALIVPLTLQLEPREPRQVIAVTEIEADLLLPTPTGTGLGTQVGSPARTSSMGMAGGLWCTIPDASIERQMTLRFALAREHVRLLEDHAQRLSSDPVSLELRLRIGAAWVRQTESAPDPGPPGHPLSAALGFVSELLLFGETRVEPLRVWLTREEWAERILPGLGADGVRLIAVRLPGASQALGGDAVTAFEAARAAYDAGEHRRAVQACRDLREAVERQLGAGDGERLADRVAERLGWSDDSPARELLDNLWKALGDVSSAGHHHRGRQLAVADARMAVLLAAAVTEYLAELLEPVT